MQWVFNLVFFLLDKLFALVGLLPHPDFIDDFLLAIVDFVKIVNYYCPLETLLLASALVLAVTIIMMIVSAFLQLG